jgi:hypothetical protein
MYVSVRVWLPATREKDAPLTCEVRCTAFQILASTSLDTTARVWNVLGTEAPPGAYKVPATATGNEGSVVVAIYAGQAPGGHTEGVTAVVRAKLPLSKSAARLTSWLLVCATGLPPDLAAPRHRWRVSARRDFSLPFGWRADQRPHSFLYAARLPA